MSSLENVSKEAIQCLVFADSYTRKFGMFGFRYQNDVDKFIL